MAKVSYNQLMYHSLNRILKPGERLQYPVYGTLFQGSASLFGYFALVKRHLLVELIDFKENRAVEALRIPLEIREVSVRKGWLGQQLVAITLEDGESYHMRFSPKVAGIPTQKENVAGLIAALQSRCGKTEPETETTL